MSEDENVGVVVGDDGRARCWWCANDAEYRRYHDEEWGFPVEDDRRLFEKLCLEAFQAGLSWITILRKRDNFRSAFDGFDFETVAGYTDDDIERLMGDTGIVRNRQKIEAVINNARVLPELIDEFGSFADYVWQFEPDEADRPDRVTREVLRTHTTSAESKALAKDLKKRGFKFVGPTITYSFMQAMGVINDHVVGCDTRPEVERAQSG